MPTDPEFTSEQEKVLLNIRGSMLDQLEADLDSTKLSDKRLVEIKDSIAVQRAELAHDNVLVDHELSQ